MLEISSELFKDIDKLSNEGAGKAFKGLRRWLRNQETFSEICKSMNIHGEAREYFRKLCEDMTGYDPEENDE